MATLSLRANLALAVMSALALAAALGMPWYGATDTADRQSIDHLFESISRIFSQDGVTAQETLGTLGTVLSGLAGTIVIASLLCLLPAVEDLGRTVLNMSSLAALAVVGVKIFDQPGANTGVDLRYGILVAFAAAGLAACFAAAAAAKPRVRKPPARMVDVHAA
jgi:hypothetical protein